jgi:competence protein ComEC
LQAGVTLLLMPLQLLLFHGISLTSMAANLLAVPLVTLLAVPLILPRCCCISLTGMVESLSGWRPIACWRCCSGVTTFAGRLADAGCPLALDQRLPWLLVMAGVFRAGGILRRCV